jgi:hypothetical protein
MRAFYNRIRIHKKKKDWISQDYLGRKTSVS